MLKKTFMLRVFRKSPYYLTSKYGMRTNPVTGKQTMHWGEDYGTNNKSVPVYSPVMGVVKRAEFNSIRGWFVEVKTGLGYVLMQHLKAKPLVKVGQKVDKTTQLGFVGTSGSSTGIHLHIEYYNKLHEHKSPTWFTTYYKDPVFPKMKVKSEELNVRNKPSITGEIKGQLKHDATVTIYKTVEDADGKEWAKISYTAELYVAKWLLY